MRKICLLFIAMFMALPFAVNAQSDINLTPVAKKVTKGDGMLVLPHSFTIATGELSDSVAVEAQKFANQIELVTGYTVELVQSSDDALITLAYYNGSEKLGCEGYTLDITAEKINIAANYSHGFFYAFQTIKKMLPACVMAGVKDENVTEYTLPVVSIVDAPRFEYRGFMLDVSRHFFTVEEVKRMIDVMSYYKMNRFHWHLTDDQGWRVEIKKYPKLTTVASIAPNCRFTDMVEGHYWINRPYGPYFYTQEQLKDVVAYAKERHIEIIPEIDMPGHFVAALVAYPEYSCNPSANRSVWTTGGISNDVLNVANPEAVQFCKDILTELMDIFPYEQVHIGGDECPTTAWENNAACKEMVMKLGLSNYRQLQSHFINELNKHVVANGRKLSVWNEAITAGGANTNVIKATGATVYAWTGADAAARKAAELGLNTIYTPWGPYYINRMQSTGANEPPGAGDGTDTVERTYNTVPVPSNISSALAKYYIGVQGTFWTEHVSSRDYMEYLALPRLTAVAEAGWSQQSAKNFADFQKRITADTLLLDYNGYNYGRHYILGAESSSNMVMPQASTAENKYWYRLVTKATGDRANKCMELLREGSSLISQYAGKQAAAGKIWTNAQVAEGDAAYDYQWWAFEKDPDGENYAIVCKAQPDGSINPNPTTASTSGRWTYDNSAKHYDFILGEKGEYYGPNGDNYYYSIRSSKTNGVWMNASLGGQGFAVNAYDKPTDGNGGLWTFVPLVPIAKADVALVDRVKEMKEILANINTYEDEKVTGAYSKSEADALAELINGANLDAMDAEALAQFTEDFNAAEASLYGTFGYMEAGQKYRFTNAVEGFEGITIAMNGSKDRLQHAAGTYINDAWVVVSSKINDDYTQTVTLRNYSTNDYIAATKASVGNIAYPVSVGTTAAEVLCSFNPISGEYTLSIGGKNFYPVPHESLTQPGIISSGSVIDGKNATRLVGAAWNVEKVHVMTIETRDLASNKSIGEGTYTRSIPAGASLTYEAPEIENYELAAWDGAEGTPSVEVVTEDINAVALYKRSAYTMTMICRDLSGAIISLAENKCAVGENYTVVYPEHKYYEFVSAEIANNAVVTPEDDMTIEAFYSTEAFNGVRALGNAVTELKDGYSYVLYDTSPTDAARIGYCNVNSLLQIMKNRSIEDTDPTHTWLLEKSGNGFKVKNEYHNLYVPQLTKAANPYTLSAKGEVYTFTLNSDGITWTIKGTNDICWDGIATGALVGWSAPGHPYKIYEYLVEPYFEVTVNCLTTEGETLSSESALVKAGSEYTLKTSTIEDYEIKEITGDVERMESVDGHLLINVIYQSTVVGIDAVVGDKAVEGIYDLSGRRLRGITSPGIYIVGGKKVIVTK